LRGQLGHGYSSAFLVGVGGAGLLVLAGIGWFAWSLLKPCYLKGVLQDEIRPVGVDAVKRDFRRDKTKECVVGSEGCQIELAAASEPSRVRLVARKRKRKCGAYVEVLEGHAKVDGMMVVRGGQRDLVARKSKIEIAGYTLRWK
jgi:hypothetical protein